VLQMNKKQGVAMEARNLQFALIQNTGESLSKYKKIQFLDFARRIG
jgi:hypothetical protein